MAPFSYLTIRSCNVLPKLMFQCTNSSKLLMNPPLVWMFSVSYTSEVVANSITTPLSLTWTKPKCWYGPNRVSMLCGM